MDVDNGKKKEPNGPKLVDPSFNGPTLTVGSGNCFASSDPAGMSH